MFNLCLLHHMHRENPTCIFSNPLLDTDFFPQHDKNTHIRTVPEVLTGEGNHHFRDRPQKSLGTRLLRENQSVLEQVLGLWDKRSSVAMAIRNIINKKWNYDCRESIEWFYAPVRSLSISAYKKFGLKCVTRSHFWNFVNGL